MVVTNFIQSVLCIFLMKDEMYLHKNSQAHKIINWSKTQVLALRVCFLLGFVVFLVSIKASAYLLVFAIETGLVHGRAKIFPVSSLRSWKTSEAWSWGSAFSLCCRPQAGEEQSCALRWQVTVCLCRWHGFVSTGRRWGWDCSFCLSRQRVFYLVLLVLNLEIICLRDCFQPGSFVFLSRASSPRRDAIKGLEKPTSTQC